MRTIAIGIISILLAVGTALAAQSDSPASVVSTVVKLDTHSSKLFDYKPGGLMQKYFTKGLIEMFSVAIQDESTSMALDGDTISGHQMVKSLTVKSIKERVNSDDKATVSTTLVTKPLMKGDTSDTVQVSFDLKREDGSWKIDDIHNPSIPSFKKWLEKELQAQKAEKK